MNWRSFFCGFGSIFNIWGPNLIDLTIEDLPSTEDGFEADRKALESDWDKIGKDFPEIQNPFNKDSYIFTPKENKQE